MAYQDHLVNHLKNKLETIKSEHSVFHSVLDNFVTKVTDNVKAVIKVGEINYEKYKDLNSSMEHVLNLLIQLRAEIQRPREGCSSINTDHVVETVLSRLSSELITKDKEMNSMLSKQRKEIEENIQRTSDEWFQKYKELTTHLDNLEVEAQNNFQKVSEQQNNTMVQQRRDSELTNSKISDMSCEVQNLQDKVMQLNSTVAANETKMSVEFAKNSELLKANILELSTIEITKSLKDPIQKIKENSSKISKVEKKSGELERRILNSTDVMKRDISEISVKLQDFQKTIAANETKASEELPKNSEQLKTSLLELTTIEITKRLNDPIQKMKENSNKISKVVKKNVELEQRILNSTDDMKRDISEISVKLQGFQRRLDTGSSLFDTKKQISEKNDAQVKKMNSGLSEESKMNTSKQNKTPADKSVEIEQISVANKRGHSSISPSDLTPQQQRHNSISNTPPPTAQYYQAIPQAFEYPQQPQHPYKAAYGSAINDSRKQGNIANAIPQAFEYPQQPQHPFKVAYGSALNDSRAQGNSARVGPTQQAIPQGGSFYQQTNQGMRNPQPPPAQPAQQYYISAQPQGGRLPRPPQLQSPVMYNPPYQGNNVIIVPNLHLGGSITTTSHPQGESITKPSQ